jgi:hypothetical protein
MSASPLNFLRAGPPPPKVALLPDALFFTRLVPISAGATAPEVAAQVELALEAVSPFPLAQLYYGWFSLPGRDEAFVYAAYRRRFTSEQAASWLDAELVVPESAALLGAEMEPSTTVILTTTEGLTAVHWDKPGVPTRVLTRSLLPEATDEERAKVREDVLRIIGGSRHVIDLAAPPMAEPATSDSEIVFRAGDIVSTLPATVASALDVRDKAELALLRNARRRDIILWRVALGCAAAIVLLGLGEIALVGGRAWQKVRLAQLNGRKAHVDQIIRSQEVTRQIIDLTTPTKRLLPLEMLTSLVGPDTKRKPEEITFTRVQTLPGSGLYTLYIEAYTNNPAMMQVYESELKKLPEIQSVQIKLLQSRNDRTLYEITATFKPEALKPSLPG